MAIYSRLSNGCCRSLIANTQVLSKSIQTKHNHMHPPMSMTSAHIHVRTKVYPLESSFPLKPLQSEFIKLFILIIVPCIIFSMWPVLVAYCWCCFRLFWCLEPWRCAWYCSIELRTTLQTLQEQLLRKPVLSVASRLPASCSSRRALAAFLRCFLPSQCCWAIRGLLNQAPHKQQYFPASLPPFPPTTARGHGGGHKLGSVGNGVVGRESVFVGLFSAVGGSPMTRRTLLACVLPWQCDWATMAEVKNMLHRVQHLFRSTSVSEQSGLSGLSRLDGGPPSSG